MQRGPNHRKNIKAKAALEHSEVRRRRQEHQIEIRRQSRDEAISKRRNFAAHTEINSSHGDGRECRADYTPTTTIIADIYSTQQYRQLTAATKFRQLLSQENPPIQEIIECGVVGRFVELLQGNPSILQFEAAWALTNIAAGTTEQTHVVIRHGAVPHLVRLLSSPTMDIREQAVWALGNIAGNTPECRDYVLEQDALYPLLVLLSEHHKLSMTRSAAWALRNLCYGKKPRPVWEQISPALPVLSKLIRLEDDEILSDACWAIACLSEGNDDRIQEVIESGVCGRLVDLLMHPSTLVQAPALRSVGNFVAGNELQTQMVIASNALPSLLSLLSAPKDSIRRIACWSISNITAGSPHQIQAVIEASIIPPLLKLLQTSDLKTKKEACWAISNATLGGLQEPSQTRYLVSQGCIKSLCDILTTSDTKLIQVALEGLQNILEVGEIAKMEAGLGAINHYAQHVEEVGGFIIIDGLQYHSNLNIYNKALHILGRYFFADEDGDTPMETTQIDESEAFVYDPFDNKPQLAFSFGP